MEELGELKINADGSFNYTLPADKSVDGNPYDLRFVPGTELRDRDGFC